ncbi:hypothetical protein BH11PSE6_BH11PSE6_21660 [soil metagenome]
MKQSILLALFSGVALSSCGGSGGSSGTSTAPVVTPAPSPTPTPTPTPTPSSYTLFDNLVGDQRYAGKCVGYVPRSTGVPFTAGSTRYGPNGPISYAASTQTYSVVTPDNLKETFEPGTLVPGTPAGTKSFLKSTSDDGRPERFSLIRPAPGGIGFDYGRIATIDISGFGRTSAVCILGVPTRGTDIPPVPSVTFTRFSVNGEAIDNRSGTLITYSLGKSSATMTVDLTTGTLTTTLHLIGSSGASDIDLGSFTTTAFLNPDTAGFFGSMGGPPAGFVTIGGTPLGGPIEGGFFGPQGREFGYTIEMSEEKVVMGRSDTVLRLIGTVVGAR